MKIIICSRTNEYIAKKTYRVCTNQISKYTDFKKYDKESFTGYKLVQKINLNYSSYYK